MGDLEKILIIVLVILLFFGYKRIPDLARNIGRSVKEVKKGFNEGVIDESKTETKSNKTSSDK